MAFPLVETEDRFQGIWRKDTPLRLSYWKQLFTCYYYFIITSPITSLFREVMRAGRLRKKTTELVVGLSLFISSLSDVNSVQPRTQKWALVPRGDLSSGSRSRKGVYNVQRECRSPLFIFFFLKCFSSVLLCPRPQAILWQQWEMAGNRNRKAENLPL